jgi:hypothetical protein
LWEQQPGKKKRKLFEFKSVKCNWLNQFWMLQSTKCPKKLPDLKRSAAYCLMEMDLFDQKPARR